LIARIGPNRLVGFYWLADTTAATDFEASDAFIFFVLTYVEESLQSHD